MAEIGHSAASGHGRTGDADTPVDHKARPCNNSINLPHVTTTTTRVSSMLRADVQDALRQLVTDRDWAQFHTPAALSRSVSIEAGELLECFQWSDEADLERVQDELADVLTYCLLLADRLELDPSQIVLAKLQRTAEKYPVDKARGRSTRYDQLPD